MILVDYKEFFQIRFDLVIRYYILEEFDWDLSKAFKESEEFIENIVKQMPIDGKKLFKNSKKLFKKEKSYEWMSNNLKDNDTWLSKNPYIICEQNFGSSVKRFLMTIKHKKNLWWQKEIRTKIKNKAYWQKETWKEILKPEEFDKLIKTENRLIKYMTDNNFFDEKYLIKELIKPIKKTINMNKTKLAMIVWQSGEKYINKIMKSINNQYKIFNIIRHPAVSQKEFQEKMMYIYTKIDPSKIAGVKQKLKENGNKTSFLAVLCEGTPKSNRHLKRKVIRPMTGVNCIHSTDSEKETFETLKYLFNYNDKEINKLYTGKVKTFDNIKDFLHQSIIISDQKAKTINNVDDVFKAVEHLKYVAVTFGPTIKEDVTNGKDIEFISDDRAAIVDSLRGKYGKAESVYIVKIGGKKVKIDNCLTFMIPEKWKNKILNTRVFNKEENCYMPLNIDRFWIHVYDRTILKPMKFKNNKRYKPGEQWNDLILFGQRNDIKVNNDMNIKQMKKLVNDYVKEIK